MTTAPSDHANREGDLRVVPADGIYRRACRMLLPDRPGEIGWSPVFVATSGVTGTVVGAAKAMPSSTAAGASQLRVATHVPAPYRRHGVGTALVEKLVVHARSLGCGALSGVVEPDERDTAMPFLLASGFATVDRMTTFEASIDTMSEWLLERRRWLIDRGEIPPSARIVPLTEPLIGPVAALHASVIGGTVPQLEACFRTIAQSPDGCDTVVLLVDGVVRGFHHCDSQGDLSMTHSLAVADELRGGGASSGWAALVLLADRLEEGTRRGVKRSRFQCLSGVRATLRMAAIFGAKVIDTREYLCREI